MGIKDVNLLTHQHTAKCYFIKGSEKVKKLLSQDFASYEKLLKSNAMAADLEYPVVECHHDKTGDVERSQGGPDDKVRVVKSTNTRFLWF